MTTTPPTAEPEITQEAARAMLAALAPLKKIADSYDDNNLDDEARRFWGLRHEHENKRDFSEIELYSGRGGFRLLTLADCMSARAAIALAKGRAP